MTTNFIKTETSFAASLNGFIASAFNFAIVGTVAALTFVQFITIA